jgi:transcriptional antiterminator RfaH
MSHAGSADVIHWYAIHTKPKQELRATSNLDAWGIETFAPWVKQQRYHRLTERLEYVIEPLFKSYIFARFNRELVNKIRFTRGVRNVVSFAGVAVPIDDEIIDLIKSRIENGFVKLDPEVKPGDNVRVECGALKGLCGIFDRRTRSSTRVLMLLKAVSYQAYAEVEGLQVRKVS